MMKQREQHIQFFRREVLSHRMHHDQVESRTWEKRYLIRRKHLDASLCRVPFAKPGAHFWRGFAQDQPARRRRDQLGTKGLAAAVVQDLAIHRHVWTKILRDPAIMEMAVPRIDIDSVVGIPECDPGAHTLLSCKQGLE